MAATGGEPPRGAVPVPRATTVLCWTADGAWFRRLCAALPEPTWRAVEVRPKVDLAARFLATLPDILVLDCRSDADAARAGRKALARLQGCDFRPAAALLAEGDEAGLERAVADGFDDVLTSSASPTQLRARFDLMLRAERGRRELCALSQAARLSAAPLAVLDARRPSLPAVWVNAAWEEASGRRNDELLGQPLSSLTSPGTALAAAAARRGTVERLRALLPRAGGGGFWADVTLSPVFDAAGAVSHVVAGACDATREIQALAAAQAAAPARPERRPAREDAGGRFTETLLDQVSTGVLTAGLEGTVTFANRPALDLLGLRPGDCIGRDVTEVFGGSEAVTRALAGLAHGSETRLSCTLRTGGGRLRDLGMTVLRSSSSRPSDLAFVVLFRDLGQRRQIEMELRRVERMNAIGIMVAGFAHEVRNPLAGIQALVETLQAECAPDDPRHEYVERMLPLLARVEHFVRASLRFGDPRPPARRRHAAAELMLAARDTIAALQAGPGVPPTELPDEALLVNVDRGQIVDCLVEMIENAVEAVHDPARVHLRVAAEPDEAGPGRSVRFEVCDDGPGVAENDLPHIFDPFFTTKPKGTGLGLALAQTLVRANGGRLLVRSVPGVETVVSLVLPEARA